MQSWIQRDLSADLKVSERSVSGSLQVISKSAAIWKVSIMSCGSSLTVIWVSSSSRAER